MFGSAAAASAQLMLGSAGTEACYVFSILTNSTSISPVMGLFTVSSVLRASAESSLHPLWDRVVLCRLRPLPRKGIEAALAVCAYYVRRAETETGFSSYTGHRKYVFLQDTGAAVSCVKTTFPQVLGILYFMSVCCNCSALCLLPLHYPSVSGFTLGYSSLLSLFRPCRVLTVESQK